MKQIINAKIIKPDEIIEDGVLLFDEKIEGIARRPQKNAEMTIDAKGKYVIPGLIDMHIHGYLGKDASDGDKDGIETIAAGILKNGVTSFLPTTMTVSYEMLEDAFSAIRGAMKEINGTTKGAEILGVHAEGPFINIEKKGAQLGEYVRKPDADFVIKHKDLIKLITLAPETDEGFAEIRRIKSETDAVISIGHTAADYETAKASFPAGVTHATHLFNAMSCITHRAPGVAGAALFDPDISCELICDTFHINPALFVPVWTLKKDKFNLITDCMRAGGLGDGEFDLGGQNVTVKGIECRLSDGTIAGSILTLNRAVYNVYKYGVPLCEAVNAASLYPAKTLGLCDRGAIEVGKRADICIADDEMNIVSVIKNGQICF